MQFTHLQYGRDHGPDHLHKGILMIYKESQKCSLPTYNMVATMVPTIYTREMKYFTHL